MAQTESDSGSAASADEAEPDQTEEPVETPVEEPTEEKVGEKVEATMAKTPQEAPLAETAAESTAGEAPATLSGDAEIDPDVTAAVVTETNADGEEVEVAVVSTALDIDDTPPVTFEVIDVRFQPCGKTYYFSPGDADPAAGDGVIVETARGIEFGDVLQARHSVLSAQVVGTLKPIIRVATQQDREQRDKYRAKEKEAHGICVKKIEEHGLDMKLVDVEYAFTGAKIVFYFTADGRVDFRELVKDLASIFKTRIELRQIGVRDEAKLLGGLGSCGRPVCCKQFLPDFQPVSIKMAKEQSLSLSPTKISGICGRLMCCLKYEQDTYEIMRKRMPKVGKEVMSPDGQGTVLENNIITEKTRLKMVLPDGTIDVRWFPYDELTLTDAPRLEPAPRPPKVERLSRRERMLQDQKARAEAAAQEAAAQNGEQAAASEQPAQPNPANKRKRPRHNRKRGGGATAEGGNGGEKVTEKVTE
ncbi:MAG: stage 0 sporulation family protein, partial [Clostridia bacterium]|nr:stage 0 sporulation family protein [Clostridia bacterium]